MFDVKLIFVSKATSYDCMEMVLNKCAGLLQNSCGLSHLSSAASLMWLWWRSGSESFDEIRLCFIKMQ